MATNKPASIQHHKYAHNVALMMMLGGLAFSGQVSQATPITTVPVNYFKTKPSQSAKTQVRIELADANLKHALQHAMQQNLANHPTWQRLHYYQFDKGQIKSLVETTDFFIHPNGINDPEAELQATLNAMFSANDVAKKEVACRFPARVHWLKTELGLSDTTLDVPACPEFDAWLNRLDPQALSVVFAEEYLDNPLSAFGHTLIKIDSSTSLANPTAIHAAHALNDTVDGNSNDSFVVYAFKSSFGGYPNKITIDPYPQKLAYYLQHDNRDVWVYRLKLTQNEVTQIMRHVWETKDLGLPYYFTNDNCASEILRFVDVVRPQSNLLAQLPRVVIPSDVVRLLEQENLLASFDYLPADNTLAQVKINAEALNLDLPQSAKLPNSVISHDFYQHLGTADDEHLTQPDAVTVKLVTTDDIILPARNNPIKAHKLQRVQVGAGHRQGEYQEASYATLDFRAGFNDLLDRPNGYPAFFDLTGISFGLQAYGRDAKTLGADDVELTHVTLLEGHSFNPLNTADAGKTWGAKLGMKQVQEASAIHEHTGLNNAKHLVGNVQYEQGMSYAFGSVPHTEDRIAGEMPANLCYAFGMGAGQVGKGLTNGYRIGAGVNVGCAVRFGDNVRSHAEVSVPYWYHGDVDINNHKSGYWQPVATLGVQYDLTDIINKNHAVRVTASHEFNDDIGTDTDIQVSYGWYF